MTTQAFVKANKQTNQPENDNPTKANPAVAHFSRFPVGSTEDEHMCELEEARVFSCSVGKLIGVVSTHRVTFGMRTYSFLSGPMSLL